MARRSQKVADWREAGGAIHTLERSKSEHLSPLVGV